VGVARAALLTGLMVLAAAAASAEPTRFAGMRACERYGAVEFKRRNPAFRRFIIDRSAVEVDDFADKVGNQFVSTIFHGKATYEANSGPRTVRFLCLYAGSSKGPVFIYTLPD